MEEVFCKGCGVAFKKYKPENYPRGVHENDECWQMFTHSELGRAHRDIVLLLELRNVIDAALREPSPHNAHQALAEVRRLVAQRTTSPKVQP